MATEFEVSKDVQDRKFLLQKYVLFIYSIILLNSIFSLTRVMTSQAKNDEIDISNFY